MHSLLLIALLLKLCLFVRSDNKEPPVISENFSCNTKETDGDDNILVKQRLAFDVDIRRTAMTAYGPLVHGGLQQIRRCDLHPTGWISSAGGENIQDASSWSCTNNTISRRDEAPDKCQMGGFWNFPPMQYGGNTTKNGVECDVWSYKSNGDIYSVWITDDAIPVANGRVASSSSNSLYTIYYTDFVPETPADSEFEPRSDCNCPDATPVSSSSSSSLLSPTQPKLTYDSLTFSFLKKGE